MASDRYATSACGIWLQWPFSLVPAGTRGSGWKLVILLCGIPYTYLSTLYHVPVSKPPKQNMSGWTPRSVAAAHCSSPQHSHNLYHHRKQIDVEAPPSHVQLGIPLRHCRSLVRTTTADGTGCHATAVLLLVCGCTLWYAGFFEPTPLAFPCVIHDTFYDSNTSFH